MNKELYFGGLHDVKREVLDNGKTMLSAVEGSGKTISVIYTDGSTVAPEIYGCYYRGSKIVSIKLSPRWSTRGSLQINRLNTSVCVNELIYQLHHIADGECAVVGEYNHYYPVVWHPYNEVFGVRSGDVCSPEQNKVHWLLCNRIYRLTGYKVSIPSYGKAFGILGLPETKVTSRLVEACERFGWLVIMNKSVK